MNKKDCFKASINSDKEAASSLSNVTVQLGALSSCKNDVDQSSTVNALSSYPSIDNGSQLFNEAEAFSKLKMAKRNTFIMIAFDNKYFNEYIE